MVTEAALATDSLYAEKVFVSNELAIISCPRCRKTKRMSAARYYGKKHSLRVRCACNTTFRAHLEFRKHYRKSTEIKGLYRITSEAGGGGPAIINDLSRGGLSFTVSGIHRIQVGQRALVEFVLDNGKGSQLSKEVEIRSVRNNHIGCRFISYQQFEKALGFYLHP